MEGETIESLGKVPQVAMDWVTLCFQEGGLSKEERDMLFKIEEENQ